jgi:hypothetical protein
MGYGFWGVDKSEVRTTFVVLVALNTRTVILGLDPGIRG